MTLKVIGTGFGRTGTDSMREALGMLGFGPCHHMIEVRSNECPSGRPRLDEIQLVPQRPTLHTQIMTDLQTQKEPFRQFEIAR